MHLNAAERASLRVPTLHRVAAETSPTIAKVLVCLVSRSTIAFITTEAALIDAGAATTLPF
jgi:hypothetical protein